MPDDIARYEEMFSTEELVARAELFGLSTGGSKRDVIKRILEAHVTLWGSKEQERLLNIERCSKLYSLEEAQELCRKAALPTDGTPMDLCRRLVDAELFPQDAYVEIMRKDSVVQTGEGLICRICQMPTTRLTSDTCDKCFHKWAVKTKLSHMAAKGDIKQKTLRDKRILEGRLLAGQRGVSLGKGPYIPKGVVEQKEKKWN